MWLGAVDYLSSWLGPLFLILRLFDLPGLQNKDRPDSHKDTIVDVKHVSRPCSREFNFYSSVDAVALTKFFWTRKLKWKF